jgi:leucyl-tRNA synthetase
MQCLALRALLHKALRDLGLTHVDEPFADLLTQGMVSKETYRCNQHNWLFPGT